MAYRTWMRVAPDGTIESVVWRLERPGAAPPTDHPVLCTERDHEPELRKNAGTNLHHDGKCVRRRKPVVWRSPKPSVAVGETIRLHLTGLPADFRRPIKIQVGEERHTLEHPYMIDLEWANAARVAIQVVDEPDITQESFMHVQFSERRGKR